MNSNTHSRIEDMSGLLYVNGQWQKSLGSTHDVINPATEAIEGHYADATPDEIESAVVHANKAQKIWWSMSALDRANSLHQVADAMQNFSRLTGECLTREMGKPFRESNWEGGAAASSFKYYAEIARSEQGRIAGPAIAGQLQMVIKEPLGVVVSRVP
ncbi:MAG: hypothetical protein RLZZ478_612 [Actinomycetota bacterium]